MKGLKGFSWMFLVFGLITSLVFLNNTPAAHAGFEEDFVKANDWDSYKGDVGHMNARLIQNVTAVLHKENIQILKDIEALENKILSLEKAIENLENKLGASR